MLSTLRIERVTEYELDAYQVVVTEVPTLLGRLLRRRPRERTFVGAGTVYHEYPSGRRPGTSVEFLLSEAVAAKRLWDRF